MTDKKEYLWRPNDNSPKTNLRYDLEASHWLDSLKHNSPKPTASFGEVFGFLGLLLSFTFNVIFFIILTLVEIVKYIIKIWPKKKVDEPPTFENRPRLTPEDVDELTRRGREPGIKMLKLK